MERQGLSPFSPSEDQKLPGIRVMTELDQVPAHFFKKRMVFVNDLIRVLR